MKVLAVVVTHNRADLLRRCVTHLLAQTRRPDGILVVNNGSTDGTQAMLEELGVECLTQDNVGSAGGWHRGIAEAEARGYEAVWLMDDDGFPDAGALRMLVAASGENVACASSVVLCEDDPQRFVFPFPKLDAQGLPRLLGWPRKVAQLDALRAMAEDGNYPFAHLFNGALVRLSAVARVGNVNRDFFIFGDEVDYFFRLRAAGKVISVMDALHYHPDVGQRPYSAMKVYYYVKNTLILHRRYFNHVWARNLLAVGVVLGRVASRNGAKEAASYLFGTQAPSMAKAIGRGLQGRIGRDFNA